MGQELGPVYLRIYRALKTELQQGDKKTGDELPSENALAAQYSTTRMTVRKSLQLLEREGLIHAWPGKGYYVSQPSHDMFRLEFREDAAQGAASFKSIDVIRAPEDIRDIFSLRPGSRVIEICRLISEDSGRVAYDMKYLPYIKGNPLIEQEINFFVPFPDIVSRMVPTFFFYTRMEIEAALPPEQVAFRLGCVPADPVLVISRYFMDQKDACIGYGRRYLRKDHEKLVAYSGYRE